LSITWSSRSGETPRPSGEHLAVSVGAGALGRLLVRVRQGGTCEKTPRGISRESQPSSRRDLLDGTSVDLRQSRPKGPPGGGPGGPPTPPPGPTIGGSSRQGPFDLGSPGGSHLSIGVAPSSSIIRAILSGNSAALSLPSPFRVELHHGNQRGALGVLAYDHRNPEGRSFHREGPPPGRALDGPAGPGGTGLSSSVIIPSLFLSSLAIALRALAISLAERFANRRRCVVSRSIGRAGFGRRSEWGGGGGPSCPSSSGPRRTGRALARLRILWEGACPRGAGAAPGSWGASHE